MTDKRVLIFGVLGQDGSYLAAELSNRGVEVHGTTRDHLSANTSRLEYLGVADRVTLHSVIPTDFRSVLKIIEEVRPDSIFNLAGQTSVGQSFAEPLETFNSIINGTLNILESIRLVSPDIRFYNACSGEIFGNIPNDGATELSPIQPKSPYGVAKSAALLTVANFRESYDLFAASGILFNHESPIRPAHFVTQKVVRAAVEIKLKKREFVSLGNLAVSRDWGFAKEYVLAMLRILESDTAEDYVIATGETNTLERFVEKTFSCLGLDWKNHVRLEDSLKRPSDILRSLGAPQKAKEKLGWSAKTGFEGLIHILLDAELKRQHR